MSMSVSPRTPSPLSSSCIEGGGVDGRMSSGLLPRLIPSSSEHNDGVVNSVSVADIEGHVRFAECDDQEDDCLDDPPVLLEVIDARIKRSVRRRTIGSVVTNVR